MERWGYDLTQRWDGRLRFERETAVSGCSSAACTRTVMIDLDEDEHGTHLVASGVAPLPVRRAFAELED